MFGEEEKRWVLSAVKLCERNLLSHEETIRRLRDIAVADNLSEIIQLLPGGLASSLKKSIARYPPLKGVGYWWSDVRGGLSQDQQFPNPTLLSTSDWSTEERDKVLAYLRSGKTYARWRGLSFCRFNCGVDNGKMGSRCLTDGAWVWPEGLPHYIERHRICLPGAFVRTMKRRKWQIPIRECWPSRETHGGPDFSFWIVWGKSR
jgi:hypothetical protein